MIYCPNPKDLVYGEINFISTRDSVKAAPSVTIDSIFDDVSQEIFNSFVAPTLEVTPVVEKTMVFDVIAKTIKGIKAHR